MTHKPTIKDVARLAGGARGAAAGGAGVAARRAEIGGVSLVVVMRIPRQWTCNHSWGGCIGYDATSDT